MDDPHGPDVEDEDLQQHTVGFHSTESRTGTTKDGKRKQISGCLWRGC